MKVTIRTYGSGILRETFDNITTIQACRGGTIVWVSADAFEAGITLTIDSDNYVAQEGSTLWVRGAK